MPIVFVVDHYNPRRNTLQSRLAAEGYHTLAMRDAEEAIQTLHCVRADLIVFNVRAHNADPKGFLTTLRRGLGYSDLPILLVGAGLTESRQLKPSIRPGSVLLDGHSLDDVLLTVHSFVPPLSESYY